MGREGGKESKARRAWAGVVGVARRRAEEVKYVMKVQMTESSAALTSVDEETVRRVSSHVKTR